MILLTNGDSWTQGDSPSQTLNWEATKSLDWYDIIPHFGDESNKCDRRTLYKFYDSPVWPKVLGEKLGIETWNCGRLGADMSRIFFSTIYSISHLEMLGKTDIFVVIQLTSNLRYRNLLLNPIGGREKRGPKNERTGIYQGYKFQYELMKISAEKYPVNSDVLYRQNLQNLIFLQSFLKQKNIPHLIYNGFDNDIYDNWSGLPEYKYIDFDYIYKQDGQWPLEPVFKNYIENNFDSLWGKNGEYFHSNHPTDKSHIEWGNHLYDYIKENYELF